MPVMICITIVCDGCGRVHQDTKNLYPVDVAADVGWEFHAQSNKAIDATIICDVCQDKRPEKKE